MLELQDERTFGLALSEPTGARRSMNLATDKSPPRVVWVSYCATCGQPIIADRDKDRARRACGCLCEGLAARVKVARYALAPKGKAGRR